MRRKRLLLAATALSAGCSKDKPEPLPGNPKGTMYDAAQVAPVDAAPIDAEMNMPANPKGTFYDAGLNEKPEPPADAAVDAAAKRDAGAPVDAPQIKRLPANPKGSLYDKGKKKDPSPDF